MKRTGILLALFLFLPLLATAQKKAITHADYDIWKSLSGTSVTDDGKWVTYSINPQQGDGWLYLYDVNTARLDSMERGSGVNISPESRYLVYSIRPKAAEVRQEKVKKVKPDDTKKNDMVIRLLPTGTSTVIPRVRSFSVPDKNSQWMAYLLEKKLPEKKESKPEGEAKEDEKPATPAKRGPEPKGTELVILNPVTNKEFRFENVTEYSVARDGMSISFLQVKVDTTKIDTYIVNMFDTKKETTVAVFTGKGSLRKVTTNRTGDKLAFIYTSDTAKVKVYDMYHSDKMGAAVKIADASTKGMPAGWCVSENGGISWSDDNTRFFFTTAAKPVKEPVDTLLPEEKFSLDVWSWTDQLLQPMQKLQVQSDLNRSYQAVYHLDRKVMIQLADESMPSVRFTSKSNGDFALGSFNGKYRMESSWSSTGRSDYFSVNVETGERKMIFEAFPGNIQTSPDGKYLLFWCIQDRAWKSMPAAGGQVKVLTNNNEVSFFDELHDTPDEPSSHGVGGWFAGERYLLVYDRYDMWLVDADGIDKPVNLTAGTGRANNMRFRLQNLDREETYIDRKATAYLSAFNYTNKQSGFYTLALSKPGAPVKLIMEDASLGSLSKPKNADKFVFTKGTYKNFPEVHISDLKFAGTKKISVTNPQQSQYNWGTVELVEWTSFDRQTLQGLLYKPENFDPNKKYPMVVYFYERSSDGLHGYSAPAPSASTINKTYAVSNGYLVFIPDIPYMEGYPGQSCYNAVVSGTYALLERYKYIDKDRLGLDGQSWGGYQIAWLITQTDLYAAAFSGAPVVNMTSAYGGIRWGSGMSRAFQYEDTQSRIGGTLWEKPIHFIENSPLFFVPKINTPVLIMANDQDGAVPWYQGIEFFSALRRLSKPAWLLTYNTEDHNLVRRPARMDLSIRKMQFFDHYLKGEPMPSWMKNGVPATEKGKNQGYELVK